jgi:hypothetical protein
MAFENLKNQFQNQLQSALKEKVRDALSDIGVSIGVTKRNSIGDFISSLHRSGGMARANQYEVEIIAHQNHPDKQNRTINLHCSAVNMPGHNLEQQTQRLGSAPAREIVQGHRYAGNITATFYLDASLETKVWFDTWQELTYHPVTHKAKYYDQYIGEMYIYQLGANGERTYGVKCDEVYPATVGPIEYAAESTDMLALLTVEFAYRKWTDVSDLKSGTTYQRPSEEFLGYSVEKLPGNGVESDFERRQRVQQLFK